MTMMSGNRDRKQQVNARVDTVTVRRNTQLLRKNYVLSVTATVDGKTFPVTVNVDGQRRTANLAPPKGQPYIFSDMGIDMGKITRPVLKALRDKLEELDLMDVKIGITKGENRRMRTDIVSVLTAASDSGRVPFFGKSL